MKKMSKFFGLFLAVVMIISMTATAIQAQGSSADQVIVAIGADPADLSPFNGMSLGRIAVLKTTYEYLLEANSMGSAAVPMLAKSVEQTGDKTYVVTIYDYITDSAGNHITSADVVFSVQSRYCSWSNETFG